MRSLFVLGLVGLTVAACATTTSDDEEEDTGTAESNLTAAQRRTRATHIRDAAKSKGLTNGALMAGIGQVETNLAHCWSEATWACQGPFSKTCNGPVIAGASDGPCSIKQGGLGLFQFDGGTFSQTLARDGKEILEIDGNVRHAVDFVANIVRQDLKLKSNAEAIAWMNGVPLANGNAKFEQFKRTLACRYNGRCGSAMQANKYGNAILALHREFGAGFWNAGAVTPDPTPAPPPAQSEPCAVKADDGRLYCANKDDAQMFASPDPKSEVVNTLRTTYSWFDCWAKGPENAKKNTTWYRTIGDDNGAAGWLPADVLQTNAEFDANPTAKGLKACD